MSLPKSCAELIAAVCAKQIEVLIDSICSASVPTRVDPLLCWPSLDELACRAWQEAPAGLQMSEEAVGFVLSQNRHSPQAGVEAVRQREVDIAEMAAERDGRFALLARELTESCAVAAGENQGKAITQKITHSPTVIDMRLSGAGNRKMRSRSKAGRRQIKRARKKVRCRSQVIRQRDSQR